MEKTKIIQQRLTGERALFKSDNLEIVDSVFEDGESPLKESKNITVDNTAFKWKYPFWYCENIDVKNSTFFEMARAGMWYVNHIKLENCPIEAPKEFRRCNDVVLHDVSFANAEETLWNCDGVEMKNVTATGAYFGMGTNNITMDNFTLYGDYCFDGSKNVEVHNSRFISKDCFWNSDNVTIYDSYISGEYFGWNSKNITLVNCTVESLQGFCYIENLKLVDCKLINTTLAFEYSTVDAEVISHIDSVTNPISGTIKAKSIGELIMDETKIDPSKTAFVLENQN